MDDLTRSLVEAQAVDYARTFDDPETIARKVAEWAKVNLPERISSAMWVTAAGEKDKGIEIRIHELTLGQRLRIQLGAAIGAWSAGLTGTVPILQTSGGVTVSVGAGAVVRYADLGKVEPVIVASVRF